MRLGLLSKQWVDGHAVYSTTQKGLVFLQRLSELEVLVAPLEKELVVWLRG
jgi:predicted transcriptional regulator